MLPCLQPSRFHSFTLLSCYTLPPTHFFLSPPLISCALFSSLPILHLLSSYSAHRSEPGNPSNLPSCVFVSFNTMSLMKEKRGIAGWGGGCGWGNEEYLSNVVAFSCGRGDGSKTGRKRGEEEKKNHFWVCYMQVTRPQRIRAKKSRGVV